DARYRAEHGQAALALELPRGDEDRIEELERDPHRAPEPERGDEPDGEILEPGARGLRRRLRLLDHREALPVLRGFEALRQLRLLDLLEEAHVGLAQYPLALDHAVELLLARRRLRHPAVEVGEVRLRLRQLPLELLDRVLLGGDQRRNRRERAGLRWS